MDLVILNQSDVAALLPINECIGVMESALIMLADGKGLNPLRQVMRLPDVFGFMGLMPGYLSELELTGLKVVSVFPGNHGSELDAHQGAVLLFDARQGRLLSIVDATAITAVRTAAVSGVATKILAREDSSVLAILGSGVQARTHLDAMLAVRPVRQVRVWSRNAANAHSYADQIRQSHKLQVSVAESAKDAVRGADIVCTTTSAMEPVLSGNWISPGTHINAVGACLPTARELDSIAVSNSRFFVDDRVAASKEAGDYIIPLSEGAISIDHIVGELGELLTERVAGRRTFEDVTVFKSLGLAIEDLAAGHYVYQKALDQGRGVRVPLGGHR